MKLCAAQIKSLKGNISENISKHKKTTLLAAAHGADLIVFPELSLTGYEPSLGRQLAITKDDPRLEELQKISNEQQITICLGIPIKTEYLPLIGMIILSPHQERQIYCKQHLHSDELPYFTPGKFNLWLNHGNVRIAPAICYESLLDEHAERAFKNESNVYLASVAKSQSGIDKAQIHFPEVAKKYAMTVMMSNSIGPCDNFIIYGSTAVWNKQGECLGQLKPPNEGFLIFDTEINSVEMVNF